jgi:hypothetical protein
VQLGGEDLLQPGGPSLSLVTTLAVEQSEEWVGGRSYMNMEKLSERRSEERAGKEMVFVK